MNWHSYFRGGLMASVAIGAVAVADAGWAQTKTFNLPAQPAATGVAAFARQADVQVLISGTDARDRRTNAVRGAHAVPAALDLLLSGTGLRAEATGPQTYSVVTFRQSPEPATETSTQSSTQVEQLTVTGTRLRNLSELPSPVETLTARDIKLGGFSTVQDVLRALPANNAIQNDEAMGVSNRIEASNESFGTSVNLRGIGPAATLVLLNGRRMAPAGLGQSVDVSLLPLAAIGRVDVLTDTASAVYGADAVAGVVNFVLKRDFSGAETSLRYGTVTSGSETSYQASQLLGANWSNGGVMAAYEFRHSNPLKSRDRSFILDQPGYDQALISPEQTQHSVLLSANHALSDILELSADVLWSERDFAAINGARALTYRYFGDARSLQAYAGARLNITAAEVEWYGSFSRNANKFRNTIDGFAFVGNSHTDVEVWETGLSATGELGALGKRTIGYAVGGSFRDESYNRLNSNLNPTSTSAVAKSRNSYALFGESSLPIFTRDQNSAFGEELIMTAAVRYERYSDFGGETVYKAGAQWRPIADLKLRATYGKSFRAPSLYDLGSNGPTGTTNAIDPRSPTGRSVLFFVSGGNADLQPETARVFTTGFDFNPAPIPGLRLSATYFNIDYRDKIGLPISSVGQALNQGAVFDDIIVRNPNIALLQQFVNQSTVFTDTVGRGLGAVQVFFDNRQQNLSSVRVNGLDFDASYAMQVASGDLSLSLSGSYLYNLEQRLTANAPPVEQIDKVLNPPDLRLRAGAVWTRAPWTFSGYANYTDDYRNTLVTPSEKVERYTTVDARLEYALTGQGQRTPVRIAVAIQNVLDTPPPYVAAPPSGFAYGYDPVNASARGRFVSVEISTRW